MRIESHSFPDYGYSEVIANGSSADESPGLRRAAINGLAFTYRCSVDGQLAGSGRCGVDVTALNAFFLVASITRARRAIRLGITRL